jgi:hypothetical protein
LLRLSSRAPFPFPFPFERYAEEQPVQFGSTDELEAGQ